MGCDGGLMDQVIQIRAQIQIQTPLQIQIQRTNTKKQLFVEQGSNIYEKFYINVANPI